MVRLTEEEISWLHEVHPQLAYDRERSVINGSFSINRNYKGISIKDCFAIEVQLWRMRDRNEYPYVYNTDGRIKRIAKRKKKPCEDLHIYNDNHLCLGLNERFYEYYPEGFELPLFFRHLGEHLYWVAYYERYDSEPWPAEKHGVNAVIDYYIEKKDIDGLRKLYKIITKTGIAKQKLLNYLKSNELTIKIKRRLYR